MYYAYIYNLHILCANWLLCAHLQGIIVPRCVRSSRSSSLRIGPEPASIFLFRPRTVQWTCIGRYSVVPALYIGSKSSCEPWNTSIFWSNPGSCQCSHRICTNATCSINAPGLTTYPLIPISRLFDFSNKSWSVILTNQLQHTFDEELALYNLDSNCESRVKSIYLYAYLEVMCDNLNGSF